MAGGSFMFVHVPCDEASPCTEWTLEYTEDTLVSCLTDHLKKHFARQARAAVAGGDLRTCAVRFAIDCQDEFLGMDFDKTKFKQQMVENAKQEVRYLTLSAARDDRRFDLSYVRRMLSRLLYADIG